MLGEVCGIGLQHCLMCCLDHITEEGQQYLEVPPSPQDKPPHISTVLLPTP